MKRRTRGLVCAVLAGLVTAGAADAEPLRIRYSTWVGYGPLFIARDKGFFEREKVEVELVNYKVVQHALDVWGRFGKLQVKVTPKDLVNHSFVK